MKGRRLTLVGDIVNTLQQPGDYCGPIMGFSGDKPAVFFLLPEGGPALHHVQSPPHTFKEEDDGTLTISASILAHPSIMNPKGWHGYLERGIWRKA